MKTNLRVVALGLSVVSAMLSAGCHEQEAKGAEIPTFVQVEKPTVPSEPPATPATAATPATVAAPTAATADTNASNAAPAPKPSAQPKEAAVIPEDLRTSPALTELIRLLQGGVSEDVLVAYITNSAEPFYIGADEILFLHDLGAPTTIITTLIHRDSSPEMLARKQASVAVKPLPPGISLTTPATNLYATATPAPAPANPPEPTAVNPPVAAPLVPPTEAAPVPIPEQPVSVSHFETELAPYGTWVEVPGYGRCWRPTVAVWNASWRPYADCGRWLWTDAGWYWYSDYSWGWAPFHYGRWACPTGLGWVWAPDTCWGPSWVSWRYSSSYCGWAPLPPSASFVFGHGFYHHGFSVGIGFEFGLHSSDYVFVSTSGLCDRRPRYLSATHSSTVFKDTTVVNNYVTVNKNTVVNKGVGIERVSQATRGNIRQVALKGTTDVRPTTPRRETLDSDGKTLTVSQPPMGPSTASAAKPSSTNPLRPRTDRTSATLSAPRGSSQSTGSGSSSDTALVPNTAAPRGTYLAPRTGGSTATKPLAVGSTPSGQASSSSGTVSSSPTSSSRLESRTRTAPAPVRGAFGRTGRTDAPTVGGSTPASSAPASAVPQSRTAPNTAGPSVSSRSARPEATRNSSAPQGNTVRGGGPTQVRPSAPAPNVSQPSARPSVSAPRVAPSAPSAAAPRTYSAPAPSAAPRTYSAPAPSAAPRSYSAPAPSASRSGSSGGSGGRSGGDGGGGGGGRSGSR